MSVVSPVFGVAAPGLEFAKAPASPAGGHAEGPGFARSRRGSRLAVAVGQIGYGLHCAEVASPGGRPMGFSDSVTMAWPGTLCFAAALAVP